MTSDHGLNSRLAALPGWSDDPGVRHRAALDRSGWQPDGLPLGVVRARSVAEVCETLALCHEQGVPVVPRGAGTGLAGGATAGAGSVVLDLSGLDGIVSLDPIDQVAVVEAGVVTAVLDRAARGHGLRYAPDPASAEISTIGGNIATNAGGMRCVKYGVTREAVLGLDVALADGRLIHTGRATAKGVAGYDLTSLFVGSEGTLGVIVGARVRLTPLPDRTATAAAVFASVEDAAQACSEIVRHRLVPSLLELLDAATLRVIDAAQGSRLAGGAGALVIVQTDGRAADAELAAIADVLAGSALSVTTAADDAAADELLAARRLALPSIEQFGRPLIEDIAVPRSRLAEAVRGVERIAAETGTAVFTFAHAGDGNLHPIISVPRSEEGIPAAAQEAADRIFALALDLGGTVTGEHGVGVLKRAWLRRELGGDVHGLHAAVKAAFDPKGILNPGKAF